jgi:hypothetical protein
VFSTSQLLPGEYFIFFQVTDCTPPPVPQSECAGSYWICFDQGAPFSLNVPSLIDDIDETTGGCIAQENRGAWFHLNFLSAGDMEFIITPVSGPFGNMRVDFAIWPMAPPPYCPMTEPPIRCSAADVTGPKGLVNGATDETQDATGDGWLAPLTVNASLYQPETYVLYVDNPTPYDFDITLAFTGALEPECLTAEMTEMTTKPATPLLWPNPAEGMIRISWMDGVSRSDRHRTINWRVLDATGRLLLEGRDQGEGTIGIEPLAPGPYLLHWQDARTGAAGAAHFVKQ